MKTMVQRYRETGVMPISLAMRPPSLNELEQPLLEYFYELSRSRQFSSVGTPMLIPYNVITDFMNEHHIFDLTEREEYRTILQEIDDVYCEHYSKKRG